MFLFWNRFFDLKSLEIMIPKVVWYLEQLVIWKFWEVFQWQIRRKGKFQQSQFLVALRQLKLLTVALIRSYSLFHVCLCLYVLPSLAYKGWLYKKTCCEVGSISLLFSFLGCMCWPYVNARWVHPWWKWGNLLCGWHHLRVNTVVYDSMGKTL